jgi:hypothetical protein
MASDSRISWGSDSSAQKWDFGCKLFASGTRPDTFGYIGDVLFPSQILGQVLGVVDRGVLFGTSDSPMLRFEKLCKMIRAGFLDYPIQQRGQFTIAYCTREGEGMESQFNMFLLSWDGNRGWQQAQPDLPQQSGVIEVKGSGAKSLQKWNAIWNRTKEKGTSRLVFSAFCDSLASGEDIFTGGAPQLVGIYRKGSARAIGIVFRDKRFLSGLPIDDLAISGEIEWRNTVFERCDGITGGLLTGAQPHATPKGLAKSK